MIDMTNLLRSVDNNHKGLQLLLSDFYNDFSDAALNIEELHKGNRFDELNSYSKKLKTILTLLCDQDLPPKMAKLEHLSRHEFPAPEELIEDVKTELHNVNRQINHLLDIKEVIDGK
ncbi:hypothetical protein [Vibrio coralliirubri]|uniref:hypothetical protein n=1 Tax=Vibrio coralliirubri TaxID=1516159 RepID=UPI000634AC58|nr:hypothetical protein [Vibrio coralliirubri]CDT19456.1 Hypothetical protein VCR6J2_250002 [Vibrio coralliirubri]CDT39454.1 Hypothetical protein VCR1J2_460070 [Vibrio coralliirubri]CDT79418.1 Hypothetical protein VCR8J2_190868 [Vibrio coralliirubri]CDT82332.1 Hypothetical protein VCR26J2_390067 [Vibrio coralliirubri]